MIVYGMGEGLDNESICTPYTLSNLHQGLAIAEPINPGAAQFYSKIITDVLR